MSIRKKTKMEKEKTYTVADLLVVLGFLVLIYSIYIGTKLLSGDFMEAVITAGVVAGTCVLFLWLLCMAKKAYNHRQAWRVLEWVILILFAAFFFISTKNARHFQYIISIKEELHTNAISDKNKIIALFDAYEESEKRDIGRIYNSIKALPAYETIYADANTKKRLAAWKGDKTIKIGKYYTQDELNDAAQAYSKVLMDGVLLGPRYQALREAYVVKLDTIVNSIRKGIGYGEFYSMSKKLMTYYTDVAAELTGFSAREQKYELTVHNGILTSKAMPNTYKADSESLQLRTHFNGTSQSTNVGWIYTAIAFCLILCPYFATHRSCRVTVLNGSIFSRKKSFTNDGGIDIC